jgi:hypothetical protein
MPFIKGESGNPAGRPLGARNRKSLLVEAMLDAESESLGRRMIERALDGDAGALRLCMERVLPRGRDRIVPYALPPIESAADARRAATMISVAIGTGELTPREGMDLLRVVEKCGQIVAAAEAAEQAARRAQLKAELLESVQDDLNRRLVQDAQARAAAMDRALARDEDGDDDDGAAAERVPAAGANGTAAAVVTSEAGQARGREAASGKNNERGNNENTMERDTALPSAEVPPWPFATTAQAGGGPAWERALAAAAPQGLRRRVVHLLGSSAMGGTGAPVPAAR